MIKINDFEGNYTSFDFDKTKIIDDTINKILTIFVILNGEKYKYGFELSIDYFDTWEDADLETLIQNKLDTYAN
jgi:hypothetical protein